MIECPRDTQTPEAIMMPYIGAARRKSGRFDRVQYLKSPTPLVLLDHDFRSQLYLPIMLLYKSVDTRESLVAPRPPS